MKVEKGIGGSVAKRDQERIEEMNKDVRFDVCPTCEGTGRAELPEFSNQKDAVYYWFRKLKKALALKPAGVELLLMNNQLVVIEEPKNMQTLEPEQVRMHLGEDGVIKYITSAINYEFSGEELPEEIDKEKLLEKMKEDFNRDSNG